MFVSFACLSSLHQAEANQTVLHTTVCYRWLISERRQNIHATAAAAAAAANNATVDGRKNSPPLKGVKKR